MLITKNISLKEIISSHGGLHLTIYVKHTENRAALAEGLRRLAWEASAQLSDALGDEDREKFLAPIFSLASDFELLERLPSNIGVFRNQSTFRLISLPIEVENQSFVATSFHVKPILNWIQVDREFLILGLSEGRAELYGGSLQTLRKIDEIRTEIEILKNPVQNLAGSWRIRKFRNIWAEETSDWVKEWLPKLSRVGSPRLYLAGEWKYVRRLAQRLSYPGLSYEVAGLRFDSEHLFEFSERIRHVQEAESQALLARSLLEFYSAEHQNRVKKNIIEITKAAVSGKIRKLIVASGVNIFGKIDRNTGTVVVHPVDMDHEDDDILDDLAQIVIEKGGEVIVAPIEDLPKHRPALAILKPDPREAVKLLMKAKGDNTVQLRATI